MLTNLVTHLSGEVTLPISWKVIPHMIKKYSNKTLENVHETLKSDTLLKKSVINFPEHLREKKRKTKHSGLARL